MRHTRSIKPRRLPHRCRKRGRREPDLTPAVQNVAFVTAHEIGITADDARIASELSRRGIVVTPAQWDAEDPPRVDAFVIRSPWNYHLAPDAFLEWIERAARHATVFNDPAVVRWNAHKRYLLDLETAGIPVAPTVLAQCGERHDLAAIMNERGWHEVVVKPAISASSYLTAIVGATPHPALQTDELRSRFVADGQAHLDHILQTRDALIQPFMPEIFTRGERSLVYLDGAYSHCVQKDAFTTGPGGGHAVEATADERRIAESALATLPQAQLYARVDLLRSAEGKDYLMELELIDPELYLRYADDAPGRFAAALLKQ
jgi:hypothetical protein